MYWRIAQHKNNNITMNTMYQTIHVDCIRITIIMKLIRGHVQGNRICVVICGKPAYYNRIPTGRIRKVKTGQRDQNATFPIFGCSRISFVKYLPV